MPCILTTLMTLLGFTLPPDAGEKITLRELLYASFTTTDGLCYKGASGKDGNGHRHSSDSTLHLL